jgi:hypothetical protein
VNWFRGVLLLALAGTLVGWYAASYHRPYYQPQVTALAPGISQDVFRADLAQVLADQQHADAVHREAWLAEGYSHDLQVVADAGPYAGALSFSAVAQAYLDAAYAGPDGDYVNAPPPGWQAGYAQLRAALNELAAANELPGAPAPPYPISGQAIPMHPWSAIVIMGNPKSGNGTSISYSTSSTGAHSQTVTTKVKNGNVTTTTTNKTSVSAKGAVTQTHTVTTSGQ